VRYKIVPPARDVAFLRSVGDALPRVPNSVEDCCTRIRDRTALQSRDVAREYLTFCQALGIAAETEGDFYRAPATPSDDELATAFEENVLGVRELLTTLADRSRNGATSVDTLFEDAVEPLVPRWERNRASDWAATWRERTDRLCEWAVVFDLVERGDGGYRLPPDQ
jgi:hypothetical protein